LQRVKDRSAELTQQESSKQMKRRLRGQRRRCEGAKSEKQEIEERVQKAQRKLIGLNQQITMIEEGTAKSKKELGDRVALAVRMQAQAQKQDVER
jgi:hypothetical protein